MPKNGPQQVGFPSINPGLKIIFKSHICQILPVAESQDYEHTVESLLTSLQHLKNPEKVKSRGNL